MTRRRACDCAERIASTVQSLLQRTHVGTCPTSPDMSLRMTMLSATRVVDADSGRRLGLAVALDGIIYFAFVRPPGYTGGRLDVVSVPRAR